MSRPRKLGYGDGSIYKEDGQYRAQIIVDGRRIRRTRSTRKEAEHELNKLKNLAEAGLPVGDDTRLGDWLDWYRDTVVSAKHPNTQSNYAWSFSFMEPLRGRRLRELTPTHLEARFRQLDLATSSISRIKSNVGSALQEAVRRDLVARNVARLAHLPVKAEKPKEKRSLTKVEAQALLRAAEGDRSEALALISLLCGLRPGEALGLPWKAVDFNEGTLEIGQALERHPDGTYVIGPPKAGSFRTVKLTEGAVDALLAHRSRQRAERRNAPVWEESGLVFTTKIGTHSDFSNHRRFIRRLCEDADIVPISPNELRHSAATLLMEAGVPMQDVADMLGHRDTRMVSAVYRHKRGVVDVTSGQEQMLK
jgi:integrase